MNTYLAGRVDNLAQRIQSTKLNIAAYRRNIKKYTLFAKQQEGSQKQYYLDAVTKHYRYLQEEVNNFKALKVQEKEEVQNRTRNQNNLINLAYRELLAHPLVQSIRIHGSKLLVKTEKVYSVDQDEDWNDVDLGKWEITIFNQDQQKGRDGRVTLKNLEYEIHWGGRLRYHPHVFKNDGTCEGEYRHDLMNAWESRNLVHLVNSYLIFLAAAHVKDAHYPPLNQWKKYWKKKETPTEKKVRLMKEGIERAERERMAAIEYELAEAERRERDRVFAPALAKWGKLEALYLRNPRAFRGKNTKVTLK